MKRKTSRFSSPHLLRSIDRISFSLGAILPCSLFPFLLLLLIFPLVRLPAAQLQEARVSQVIRDVKLLPQNAAPRPAKVSDQVRNGTAVRTGEESRTELTFSDQTLARLGANTIFTFDQGTRNLELSGGAMLLRVPKNAGGAQIHTAAVSAAITGTTVMLEYHPNAYIKFIILEGTGRIFRKDHVGESVLLHAGQMLIVNPKGVGLPDPVDVDVDRLMKTSLLIQGFSPLLSTDLIAHEIAAQTQQKNSGELIQTNLVIYGGGTAVSLTEATDAIDQRKAATESSGIPGSEEPPPPTVTPTPTITPSVTPTPTMSPTPTVTPSPTVSPTPIKTGTPIVISSPVPYVIDSSTVISTDPTITTNGITDFGKQYRSPELDGSVSTYLFGSTSAFDTLIGFDQIVTNTENVPAAVFKFQGLLLAGNPTISLVNGGASYLALVSVGDLTSGAPGGALTFDGINGMLLATQDGSINLGPEISFEGIPRLYFYARGTGSSLTLDSPVTGTTNLTLASEGDIVFNNAFSLTESGAIDQGFNFIAIANTNLVATNGLTVTLDNSNGGDTLDQPSSIGLETFGALTANGDAGLNLTIANNGGGHIGGGASIDLFTGGTVTASAVNFLINDRDAGTIDGPASILWSAQAINVTNELTGVITTRNDGLGGGTIADDASILFTAASVSTGSFIDLALSANAGGTLSTASLTFSVAGSVIANGGYFSLIQSTGFSVNGGPFVQGGTINGNATLALGFGSMTSGDVFDVEIDNFGEGTIAGDALLSVGSGSLNSASDMFTDIINTAVLVGDQIVPGGNIDGNAMVTIATGDLVSSGVGEFAVLNNDANFLSEGGTIDGSATVTLEAINITTGNFFQPLVNNTNGIIGGDASVFVFATGDINVGEQTFFNILNGGGTIGGQAVSTLVANNFTSGSEFDFQIVNDNGTIGDGATLVADVAGNLTGNSDAFIQITNSAGLIGSDATVDLTAGNLSTVGNLNLFINDISGGSIGGSAAISLNASSVAASSLFASIESGTGSLGPSASINLNVSGTVTTTSDTTVTIDLPLTASDQSKGKQGDAPSTVAAIDFNGGTYEIGGTLLSTISGGDGGITLGAASMHADILKIGAFGTNGSLIVGSGPLSGDTELKLYANGSNGTVTFVSNVSLSSNSSVIIAGNTVTVNNGVVVTIAGDDGVRAGVFTNVPNYSGSGGNGSTTGLFAGNGATTAPLDQAPPFDDPTGPNHGDSSIIPKPVPNAGSGGGAHRRGVIAKVNDSDDLLALVDKVTSGQPATAGGRPNASTKRSGHGPTKASPKGFFGRSDADRDDLRANRGLDRRPSALP